MGVETQWKPHGTGRTRRLISVGSGVSDWSATTTTSSGAQQLGTMRAQGASIRRHLLIWAAFIMTDASCLGQTTIVHDNGRVWPRRHQGASVSPFSILSLNRDYKLLFAYCWYYDSHYYCQHNFRYSHYKTIWQQHPNRTFLPYFNADYGVIISVILINIID